MEKEKTEAGDKKNKSVYLMVGVLTVVVIALVIVVIVLLNKKETKDNTDNRELVNRGYVDDDNGDNVVEDMQSKVAEGMFECTMSYNWTFEDGTAESKDAYVANSDNNRHTICFDVIMDDTGETVYASPLISVGQELYGIKLDKDLDAGEYSATVRYKLVDEKEDGNYEEISSAGFTITISVLN